MNHQPDKFFREKLEGFQKTAPSLAWEKIEAGLDKKSNKGLWLKIAAAILFLAVGSFTLWSYRNSNATIEPQTAVNKERKVSTPVQKELQDQKVKADASSLSEEIKPEQIAANKPKNKKSKSPVVVKEENQIPVEPETIAQAETTSQEVMPVVASSAEAANPEEVIQITEPVVAVNSVETEEPVTIVYSAEEVNEKYLDKVALAKATSEQKKPSTFRKLLEKAYDLKNKQDPFGGLRQKKNEILALNFKSEKRSQTKQEHEQ
jgi:hypothetical protein